MSDSTLFEPSPEHDWLRRLAGEWAVDCSYQTLPDEEPVQLEGREVAEMMGSFWLVGRFEADMLGTLLSAHFHLGFDPEKQLFVATWKDTYTPFDYRFEGKLNDEQTLLTLEGKNFDPMRRQVSTYRNIIECPSDSERTTTLSVEVEGEDLPLLKYHYKRK